MGLSETVRSTPEDLAQQLAALVGGSVSIYSIDPRDDGGTITFTIGPPEHQSSPAIPGLAKWLRVNERPVSNPDRQDVVSDLPPAEKEWLAAIDARICVPLVLDEELIGIACVHGKQGGESPSDILLNEIHQWSRGAAVSWRHLLENQRAEREAAAAYRTHQLTTTGQLAASVAHEVRNPLAAVRSIVQLVRDTAPTHDRQSRLLGDVLAEVDRIDYACSGLLGLARPHDTSASVSDLVEMTTGAVRFIETLARRNGIQLRFEVEGSASVRVDPREFRQVLLNVLLNACEACGSGDEVAIIVGCQVQVGKAEVQVRDTGPGIPPAILSRVFDPFFTTKPSGSGFGLGVSLELIRKHGGDIRIESAETGTVVTLELPLVTPA